MPRPTIARSVKRRRLREFDIDPANAGEVAPVCSSNHDGNGEAPAVRVKAPRKSAKKKAAKKGSAK